ncbi:hypothetical protein GCM10023085_52080 [Actinomadura viridis]|uniref:Uncharacterized protein n=1 Tax=Actinomadura viridis TaxID=58110 RepID=A0A931DP54_9ACTN|nr:hypothetical protein [Actinomadura viridis]MBG6092214.1 hypothetical protein [Actinomadura viridis]
MYAWIWRRLPGGRQAKAATAAGLVLAVCLVLWYVVFPRVESRLQIDQGVMHTTPASPSSPAPDRR